METALDFVETWARICCYQFRQLAKDDKISMLYNTTWDEIGRF